MSFIHHDTFNRRSNRTKWTKEEEDTLLKLIQEKTELLNKRNDRAHLEAKASAWKDIVNEMNTKFGDKFSDFEVQKLKSKWVSIKKASERLSQINVRNSNYHMESESSYLEKNNVGNRRQLYDAEKNDLVASSKNCNNKPDENLTTKLIPVENIKTEKVVPCQVVKISNNTILKENSKNIVQLETTATQCDATMFDQNSSLNVSQNESNKSNYDEVSMDETSPVEINQTKNLERIKMEIALKEKNIVEAIWTTAQINKIIAVQKLKRLVNSEKENRG